MIHEYLDKPFKNAEALILELFPGLRSSAERCRWCCLYLLKQNEAKGHTKLNASILFNQMSQNYPELIDYVYEAITTWDRIYYDKSSKATSIASTYYNESLIAEEIKKRINNPVIDDMDWQKYRNIDDIELTDEQMSLLESVCNNSVVMLNGSAGCGKTSATRALTQMLYDNGKSFALLAPTGIAAKRLRQATGKDASTIHRFLASGQSMGEYLIIDECSMAGANLLGLLFTNLSKKTKIILICDEAQLASISCGNIVKDIIDSGIVPIVNLTHVFRYGTSGLATIATDVRTGKEISANTEFDDYSFIQIDKQPINDVLNVYAELLKTYKRDDILILSPFNVKEAGTYVINKAIQDKYNSNPTLTSYTRQSVEIDFKANDIIVNTENNYHMMGENFSDIPVMNGDVGRVLGYDESSGLFEAQFESGIAYLEKGDIYKQLLGYCLTAHKVQGMQAKAVIVVIDKSHGFFLTRNLCYVAMSRAQEKLVVIGDIDTINESLKIQEEKRRNTWLKELLINGN
nr:MAG TPA: ATP dependent DNA helicase [Caudoviricetes sp.]